MCEFVGSLAGEESLRSRVQLLDATMLYALCLLLGKEIRAYGVRSGDAVREGVEEMMWRGGQPRDADVRLWMDGWMDWGGFAAWVCGCGQVAGNGR